MRASLRLCCLAAVLGLVGCGGGGGAAPPTIDLTGSWQLFMTPTGSPDELGPSPVFLEQTGASVDGAAITGTVSANTFSLTSTPTGLFTIRIYGALVGNEAEGTLQISGLFSASGTFRLVRFAPAGTMTANGTVQGVSFSVNTGEAIGTRSYSDLDLTVLEDVRITAAAADQHLDIFFTPAGLAVGSLGVPGTVVVTVSWRDDVNVIELDAEGGTVTVTAFDDNGFTGSFSLTFPGGDTLTGTFDVVWDIEAYAG